MSNTTKFEAGKTYEIRYIVDGSAKDYLTVIKRTPMYIVADTPEAKAKRFKVNSGSDGEYVLPFGRYSMAPTCKAKRVVEETTPEPIVEESAKEELEVEADLDLQEAIELLESTNLPVKDTGSGFTCVIGSRAYVEIALTSDELSIKNISLVRTPGETTTHKTVDEALITGINEDLNVFDYKGYEIFNLLWSNSFSIEKDNKIHDTVGDLRSAEYVVDRYLEPVVELLAEVAKAEEEAKNTNPDLVDIEITAATEALERSGLPVRFIEELVANRIDYGRAFIEFEPSEEFIASKGGYTVSGFTVVKKIGSKRWFCTTLTAALKVLVENNLNVTDYKGYEIVIATYKPSFSIVRNGETFETVEDYTSAEYVVDKYLEPVVELLAEVAKAEEEAYKSISFEARQLVLDSLDYDKIRSVMILTGHKWRGETPEVDELRAAAMALLGDVADKRTAYSAGTGGFCAYRLPYGVSLVFSPPTWASARSF